MANFASGRGSLDHHPIEGVRARSRGLTATQVVVQRHRWVRVPEDVGDLPSGEASLIQEGSHGLAEGVEDPPVACPLSERHAMTVGQVRGVDVATLAVREDRLIWIDHADVGLTLLEHL